jgi:hypothetical protein
MASERGFPRTCRAVQIKGGGVMSTDQLFRREPERAPC